MEEKNLEIRAKVLELRQQGLTFEDIGEQLGITRQRANQLLDIYPEAHKLKMTTHSHLAQNKVPCPECGELFRKPGLRWHRILKHGNPIPVESAILAQKQNTSERSETHMTEQNTYCPHCHEKERQLDKKDREIEKVTEQIAGYQSTVKALTEQLEATKNQKPAMPSLQEVIQHCESGQCTEHAAEWEEVKKKIAGETMKKITPAMVEEWATKLGMTKPNVITVGGST